MAVNLSGKVRPLLDVTMGVVMEYVSADGRALVALRSSRLAMGFTRAGDKEDVDLSWHDWNSARDISADGKSVLFEDASDNAGPKKNVVSRRGGGGGGTRGGGGGGG